MAPHLDLLKCSASELASFLLEHRFENDGMETTAFLLECTTTLPNADAIAAQIMDEQEESEKSGAPTDSPSKATTIKNKNNDETKDNVAALVSGHSDESSSTATTTTANAAVVVMNNNNDDNEHHDDQHIGDPLHAQPVEVSLTNPRGKFHLTFHQRGIQATTINKNPQSFVISAGAVQAAIVFPKPTDCQRITKAAKKSKTAASSSSSDGPMILLCFKDDNNSNDGAVVNFKEKPLSQICFALPAALEESLQAGISKAKITAGSSSAKEAWIQLLCHSLQIPSASVFQVSNPNDTTASSSSDSSSTTNTKGSWTFQSYREANTSTTSGGMPFVKCYYGVQDGCLYPMVQGLLFFKPPLFVPRSKLHSIACGRGTGASSRYVDMVITTNDETPIEFTNISREELVGLNDYIHKILIPAMQRDQLEEENDDDDNDVKAKDDDDMDDDDRDEAPLALAAAEVHSCHSDDVEVAVEEVQVVGVRGGRPKRRAAREATQQTRQHFLQCNNGAGGDEEDDDDDDSEDDAPFVAADDDNDDSDSEDEEDELTKPSKGGSKGGKGKKGKDEGYDHEEEDDDDDFDVEEEEEDITETDGDETEDDESKRPAKKRRSK